MAVEIEHDADPSALAGYGGRVRAPPRASVALDHAADAGFLEARAHGARFLGRLERAEVGAEKDSPLAKVSPLDDRAAMAQHVGMPRLQRAVARLRAALGALRRDLDHVTARFGGIRRARRDLR